MDPEDIRERARRIQEGRRKTLENNIEFFSQFSGQDLELAMKVYNHVVLKANLWGYRAVILKGPSDYETRRKLAEKLTNLQEATDNLDR